MIKDYDRVNNYLVETVPDSQNKILNDEIDVEGLSLVSLRDILYTVGQIVTEYLDDQAYVFSMKCGWFKMRSVILAAQLDKRGIKLAVFSDGLIGREKVCREAINELKSGIWKYNR